MGTLKKLSLSTWILIGLVLGIIVGAISPDLGKAMKPLGDVFIRMIKMIVVPLIFSSLIMGIAGTGDFKKLGRLGGKSIVWFEVATTLALVIGLLLVNLVGPGHGVNIAAQASEAVQKAAHAKPLDHMLEIIFFSCIFAIAAAKAGDEGKAIISLSKDVTHIMFNVTHYVMKVSPIGIFGAIAYTVGLYGLDVLLPLIKLIACLYVALIIFLILVLAIASAFTKVSMFKLIVALKEPLLLAFTTSASEAALPIAMDKLERLGIPKHIVSFVLPLGYTFNLDGSTLYSCLATMFLAQMYGIEMSITAQIGMLLVLMVSTKGIAGVPGSALIVIASTVSAFGIPVEGIAIILGIDRILDMARTCCNVTGNCIAAVVVARWEKEATADAINYRIDHPYTDSELESINN